MLIEKLRAADTEVIVGVWHAAELLHDRSVTLLHYNILFPFEQRYVLRRGWSIRKRLRLFRLLRDQKRWGIYGAGWRKVAKRRASGGRATVLVTAREELLQRVDERSVIDPLTDLAQAYQSDLWLAIYESVDLHEVYRLWLAFLRERGIEFEVLWSTAGEYRPLREEDIPEVLDGPAPVASPGGGG